MTLRNHQWILFFAILSVVAHSLFTVLVLPQCLCGLGGSRTHSLQDYRYSSYSHVGGSSKSYSSSTKRMSSIAERRRTTSPSSPVRIAWGIVSRPQDEEFRSTIRQTYLAEDPRICPLSSLTSAVTSSSTSTMEKCQIAYCFVIMGNRFGKNPKGTRKDNINNVSEDDDKIDDTIYINSRRLRSSSVSEWFHYASQFDEIDYVAKVDLNTLIYPTNFIDIVLNQRLDSPYLKRVYGGQPVDRISCGGMKYWKCRQMVGQTYMSPELFFLSKDLARTIPPDIESDSYGISNWLYDGGQTINSFFSRDFQNGNAPILQLTLRAAKQGLWEIGPTQPAEYQERWNDLKRQGFKADLLMNTPRTPRPSVLEDLYFYYIPWERFPKGLTKFNLV